MSLQTFSRRTVRAVLVGGAALAIAAPAASARFDTGAAQSARCPAPPPSSIAASAGGRYATLRAVCANGGTAAAEGEREAYAVNDRAVPAAPKPEVSAATASFDWASAAIGAAISGGLLLLLLAAVRRRSTAPTAVSG